MSTPAQNDQRNYLTNDSIFRKATTLLKVLGDIGFKNPMMISIFEGKFQNIVYTIFKIVEKCTYFAEYWLKALLTMVTTMI
jgi:hypothetical protein